MSIDSNIRTALQPYNRQSPGQVDRIAEVVESNPPPHQEVMPAPSPPAELTPIDSSETNVYPEGFDPVRPNAFNNETITELPSNIEIPPEFETFLRDFLQDVPEEDIEQIQNFLRDSAQINFAELEAQFEDNPVRDTLKRLKEQFDEERGLLGSQFIEQLDQGQLSNTLRNIISQL